MNYIAQGMDSCCFVYAVANFQIWRNMGTVGLPDLEVAKDLAKCRHGATIEHEDVVNYFGAPLKKTDDLDTVFAHGGIINIKHPIWNAHSFLIFPSKPLRNRVFTAVNSWLGPLVATGLDREEISQFVVTKQFGSFWVGP